MRDDAPEDVDAAEVLEASLDKVGISTRVDEVDGKRTAEITGAPKAVKKNGYGIVLAHWGADFPTGQTFWRPLVDSRFIVRTGNRNVAEVNDPDIDRTLDAAVDDPESSGALYKKVNHAVAKGAYYLPLVYTRDVTWRSPN